MQSNTIKLLLVIGAVSSTFAQQSATLSGNISDASGAVVDKAIVKATNVNTGEVYSSAATAAGVFTIPLIKPGDYEFTTEAPGFKQFRQTGLRLETGTTVRVDVALEVGEVAETVTVEAAAPLLNTDTSSVGSVVRNSTIASMPLIDRRAAQLARLNGFVVQNGSGSNFAMAGGRGQQRHVDHRRRQRSEHPARRRHARLRSSCRIARGDERRDQQLQS